MTHTYKAMENLIKQVEIEKYNFCRVNRKEPTHIFINEDYLLKLVKENIFRISTKEGMFFLNLKICWINEKGFSVGTLVQFDEVQDEHC